VAYPRSAADKVEATVTRALQKVVGEVEGHYVKALRGAPSPTTAERSTTRVTSDPDPLRPWPAASGVHSSSSDSWTCREAPRLAHPHAHPLGLAIFRRDLLNDLLLSCRLLQHELPLHGDNQKSKVVGPRSCWDSNELTRGSREH